MDKAVFQYINKIQNKIQNYSPQKTALCFSSGR